MFGVEVKISRTCFSGLAKYAVLETFWHTSCTSSMPSCFLIVFVLAYIVSNKVVLVLEEQKILFWNFLLKLGGKFSEFYLL